CLGSARTSSGETFDVRRSAQHTGAGRSSPSSFARLPDKQEVRENHSPVAPGRRAVQLGSYDSARGKLVGSKIGRISHSPPPRTLRNLVVHSTASSMVLASRIAYDATSSLDSVNGPSVTTL